MRRPQTLAVRAGLPAAARISRAIASRLAPPLAPRRRHGAASCLAARLASGLASSLAVGAASGLAVGLTPGLSQASPPAPLYAADPSSEAPQGFDRYGGGSRVTEPDETPRAPLRTLTWDGKTIGAQAAPSAPEAPALPPPPLRRAAAQGQSQGPRFYSVHRDYGIEPDPIPLAPQFFGPTADLTQPAPGPTPRTAQRALAMSAEAPQ